MIKIHGKNYIEVKDRIRSLIKEKKQYSIRTEILEISTDRVVMKATLRIQEGDQIREYMGHAFEERNSSHINKTSYVENCETSAIGRACAAAGYGIEDAYASANEVVQAKSQQSNYRQNTYVKEGVSNGSRY